MKIRHLAIAFAFSLSLGTTGALFAHQAVRSDDPPPEEPPPEKEPARKPGRDPKTGEKDGVSVTASLKVIEHGFAKFDVVAKNSNDAKRTLKGKIRLKKSNGDEAGTCTIYAEIPASGETSVVCNAKEKDADWADFELDIEKIFKF